MQATQYVKSRSPFTDDNFNFVCRFWLPMLQAVVGVFELPEDDTVEDEHFVEIDEAQGRLKGPSKAQRILSYSFL